MKRIISFFIAITLLVTALPLYGIISLRADSAQVLNQQSPSFTVGSEVKFGRYPQWKVTKKSLEYSLAVLDDSVFTNNRVTLDGGRTYCRKGGGFYYSSYIDWIIIERTADSFFLISKNILEWRDFGNAFWHESSIRDWLNGDFYQLSFSEEEKAEIKTEKNSTFYHSYDNAYITHLPSEYVETTDNVFLLDQDQATSLPLEIRIATGTEYCGKHGEASRWYVRGPARWNYGSLQERYVEPNGEMGAWYGTYSYGIRPVIKVDKDYIMQSQSGIPADESENYGTGPDSAVIPFATKDNGELIPGVVPVVFDSAWLFNSPTKYQHDLARFCSDFAMLGYFADTSVNNAEYKLKRAFMSMGFEGYMDVNLNTGRDQMNYFIVSREIKEGEDTYLLVFAGLIGSHKKQWNSDFDPEGLDREKTYAEREDYPNTHLGFADACEFVKQKLQTYLKSYYGKYNEKIKILLTGHSRGAAAANLLAAKIIDSGLIVDEQQMKISKENIFAYTFATPRAVKDVSGMTNAAKYDGIFNIVNPEDFVTKVMLASWKYKRYGKTLTLPCKTNAISAYNSYIGKVRENYTTFKQGDSYKSYPLGENTVWSIISSMSASVRNVDDFYNSPYYFNRSHPAISPYEFFVNYILPEVNGQGQTDSRQSELAIVGIDPMSKAFLLGKVSGFFVMNQGVGSLSNHLFLDTYFGDAHEMQTYAAFMHTLPADEIRERNGYRGSVNCPVDVEIYETATGELVGSIKNNSVNEALAAKKNAAVMTVEGDEKTFWLPEDRDYRVVLTGNDNGKMDYTISVIDSDSELTTARKNYFGCEVKKGVSMTMDAVPKKAISTYDLKAENGTVIPAAEVFENNAIRNFTVSTHFEGSDLPDAKYSVESGSYVDVLAPKINESVFNGWYVNSKLISTSTEYRFRPTADVTLTAKYMAGIAVVPGDVSGDGEVTAEDARLALRAAVGLENYAAGSVEFLAADVDKSGDITSADARLILRRAVGFNDPEFAA